MEDEPDVPEPLVRRSKRNRVQTRTFDGLVSDIRDIVESEEESADEFVEPRRKPTRTRTVEAAPSTTASKAFDQNLIEVVKSNGKFIPQVVKSWVERYEKDPKPAMVELLTMLFEACGATYHIQGEFLDETNVDDVVVALVNLAAQGRVEDYQNSKKKEFRSFKENLVSFWDNLVSECQNGPLFDQVLFDKCMDYVIALSCTPPRVYRHVASMVGLQMVTSFIGAAKILAAHRQTTQRQLTAEKKKNSEGPHIDSLNKRLSEMHEKITMIEEMMRKIFTGLFVHRYRDIDPEIRMSCIQSLGTWIISYPSLFLQDLYLKYLGWTLNDKNAGVRKASVLALQNLYDVDDNVPSLGLFTERFYKRMLDLADDLDLSVAVCAISLVKQLLRHQLVPDDDLGSLYDLLIDDPPEIRHAIGALVYDHVVAQKFNNSQSRSSGDEGDSWEMSMSSWEMIDSNRKDITVAMMKNYAPLMRKYMTDKTKVPSLVEIIVHMNLELYSLKRQEQGFKTVLDLIIETFFKHGDKDALRSCVKSINFCTTGSRGELQDFAQNKLKKLEEELIVKLKAAIKEVADGDDEYSLLVNMKRLYELQLLRPVPIESLYDDIAMVLKNFRHIDDEVVSFLLLNMYIHVAWCLCSIMNSKVVSEESLSSLVSKRNILFNELDYFLQNPPEAQGKGTSRNLIASRVCTILAESWCLFRKPLFEATHLESLGYCPDISTIRRFWKLCEQQFDVSDETEDEEANKEYVEETNRDSIMIAASKLVATEAVPKEYLQEHLAPDIISHYVMHGPGVAEVVKSLIISLRKKNEDVSDIFLGALKQAYGRYLSTADNESLSAQRFKECKDLSARLSGFFVGAAARMKYRGVILKIMHNGINLAFMDRPWRFPFLMAAIINFASRLAKSDNLAIIKDLEDRTRGENMDQDPSGWAPFKAFMASLHEKCLRNEDEKEVSTVKRGRGRPRKKPPLMEGKKLFADNTSSEDEDSIDEEENQMDEDDEVPMIHSIRASAKLRALRLANKGHDLPASASKT
ncbi:sister-chromatid cohesion protein 3 [Lactuca sativa]|nr:sister-chromatid cohesion protein 3 [Lactuca sativa]